jgi:rhodanese-related sulfurtransferase
MKKIAAAAVTLVLVAGAATAQYKPKGQPQQKPASTTPPITVERANAQPVQQSQPSTEFRRISRQDAYDLYKAGKAVFVDVRSHQSFTTGHIRGAVSIPGSQLITRFGEVQQAEKLIITYCACDAEQSSGKAVQNLTAHGVKNAAALKGGYNEWKAAGLPIAAGPR